ncbi:hypothetical protein [Lacipirellula sp.]|uniref:hypothetical protein n=1 Tax=Lacipirellula sp. TaxID=2691419 RepID=UPI003D13DA96
MHVSTTPSCRRMSAGRFFLALSLAASLASTAAAQSPYATTLVAHNGAFGGAALYNDSLAVLGEPTRVANNNDPVIGTAPYHIKIVEPAYNRDLNGNKIITTLSRRSNGGGYDYGFITVKFDQPIVDDPVNPYGIDLNVFGNSFYIGNGFVSDSSDMRAYNLVGGLFAEPVVISVSPDNVNWYTYANGPYGDTAFPTQGTQWSGAQYDAIGNGWTSTPTDFTKPVNPTLDAVLGIQGQQISAANAIGMYLNSGGGTGIDLAPSGFSSIQYVRVEATAQFRDGEIDGFADVRPMTLGDSLSITPANVDAGTRLFFQRTADPTKSAVIADFSAVADLAKLTTGPLADETALAALAGKNVLANFALEVTTLVGDAPVAFAADYRLSVSSDYAGDGSDLQVLAWLDDAWSETPFTFDATAGMAVLEDWTAGEAWLAIVQTAAASLPGDYDDNGLVDGADFLAWQRAFGGATPLHNETASPGIVDAEDLNVWKQHFGVNGDASTAVVQVPEPSAFALALVVIAPFACRKPRRS